MPFGARTMPSSLSVPTCRPALPGGRFFANASCACCRPTKDSNGSRRAIFTSLSTGLFSETVFAAGVEVLGFAAPVFAAADFAAAGLPADWGFAVAGFAGAAWLVAAGFEPVAATAWFARFL